MKVPEDGVMSPATESTGARTPTSRRPARNPWTIFMRLQVPANEQEVRDFFGDAKNGVSRARYLLDYIELKYNWNVRSHA